MQKHLGLALVFLSLIQAHAADNILANPSFLNPDLNGVPDSWELYMPAANSAAPARADVSMFSLDKTVFKDQSPSIKLTSDQVVRMGVEQEGLPLIAGQKLHVQVWMKGEKLDVTDNSGAWVRLAFSNRGDAELQKKAYAASLYLKSPASTFDWQLCEGDVVVPAEATGMEFAFFLQNSKGTAWFESPSVEVIDGPANPPGSVGDPNDLQKYRQADAELGAPTESEPRVVFMGDSITEKWKLPTSFPQEHDFINRGISGQKTYQILARFPQDALALKPKVVWLLGGTNDLAGGAPLEWITNNLKAMIELCKQNNVRIIVTSILPVSDYHAATNPAHKRTADRPPEKILELNKELADLCQKEGVTYLDLHSKLVDDSGQMPADLADDGLHPTAQGYALIAPVVADAIHAELAK